MKSFLILTLLLNVLCYGLGEGWFHFIPDQTQMANEVARPTQYRPKNITIELPGSTEHHA